MLRPRIIPCLLIYEGGLVKTVKFNSHKYVGDPINTVKIFNEKEIDELMIFDINATVKYTEPNYNLINKIANECRMPFCYGGGITSVDQALKIISLGVEKIAINSSVHKNYNLLDDIGKVIGSQSVVVVIDIKKSNSIIGQNKYHIYSRCGTVKEKIGLNEYISLINDSNVGEIVINSIDRDGVMSGYDFDLVRYVRNLTDLPLTVLGGAGNYNDLKFLISEFKIIGASAGSLFVFKGKYRAVLINYPNQSERDILIN